MTENLNHRFSQKTADFRRFTLSLGIVQKVFSEKASAIARMRQKCVRNASKMHQNESCFIGKRGTFQNASEMRQNCIKNASEMRGIPLGENTFWTMPILLKIPAFGGRRKPKIFAENRRKPQIGLCHLRSVTFSSALAFVRDCQVNV